MEDRDIAALPHMIETENNKLAGLLGQAIVKQWQRPPVQHMDKAGGGAASLVSNPTADIALDTGRLKLRSAVLSAGRELLDIERRLEDQRRRLHAALVEYYG